MFSAKLCLIEIRKKLWVLSRSPVKDCIDVKLSLEKILLLYSTKMFELIDCNVVKRQKAFFSPLVVLYDQPERCMTSLTQS